MKTAYLLPIVGLALAMPLSGCNVTVTSVTASICVDAVALKASSIPLNSNETTALNGILATCAATAGGTVFTASNDIAALIADAYVLEQSGLFSNIVAQAPNDQKVLRKIKLHWQKFIK